LLAISAVHHHLIKNGKRTHVGLVLESGEPREVHHFALLIGYGAAAVNPYLAFETLHGMIEEGQLGTKTSELGTKNGKQNGGDGDPHKKSAAPRAKRRARQVREANTSRRRTRA